MTATVITLPTGTRPTVAMAGTILPFHPRHPTWCRRDTGHDGRCSQVVGLDPARAAGKPGGALSVIVEQEPASAPHVHIGILGGSPSDAWLTLDDLDEHIASLRAARTVVAQAVPVRRRA